MLSAIVSACARLLSSGASRIRIFGVGVVVGAAVAGASAWYVQGARIDGLKAEQLLKDVAAKAAQAQAKKATEVVEAQYEQTLKDAAAVARSNATVIERLRQQASAAKRGAASCPNEKARLQRVVDASADLAEWSVDCLRRVAELEAQINALQAWIKVHM